MLEVGTVAPDFVAVLDDGSPFRLSDLRGHNNVVLYFYPRDFTLGCTRQACSFRDAHDAMLVYDAILIGVSADSPESHRAFKEQYQLSFPIISDPDRSIGNTFDVLSSIPKLRPRVTYVIDKQGVIRAAFRHDILVGRHISDSLAALRALTLIRQPEA